MSILLNGDCLELMKDLEDNSVDLIFTDLPYGQVSCEWDVKIDFAQMWEEFMRIKKERAPIFFCCSTKFGVEIINSAPKKCPFRYDIVWVKSAPCGFLSAKKMPMKKHEMLYVFYEKLPFYDLSSHKHKFKKEVGTIAGDNVYSKPELYRAPAGQYEPPLPTSVQKEDPKWKADTQSKSGDAYGEAYRKNKPTAFQPNKYEPPLPTSVQKEELQKEDSCYGALPKTGASKEAHSGQYDPPLPVSVVKEGGTYKHLYGEIKDMDYHHLKSKMGNPVYEPPLPNSILEIKSQRGKHSTQKPTDLMKWVLKYYSKEGDVVLDPTMGSGSTGVACKEMNRNFIGMEMNPEIYEVAVSRIEE